MKINLDTVIFSKLLPFRPFLAMGFFGKVWIRKEYEPYIRSALLELDPYVIGILNEEYIHLKQERELLYIGFWLFYIIEWVFRLITPPWSTAYDDTCFEREAKDNCTNPNYLSIRPRFAWTKYLGFKFLKRKIG